MSFVFCLCIEDTDHMYFCLVLLSFQSRHGKSYLFSKVYINLLSYFIWDFVILLIENCFIAWSKLNRTSYCIFTSSRLGFVWTELMYILERKKIGWWCPDFTLLSIFTSLKAAFMLDGDIRRKHSMLLSIFFCLLPLII